MRYAVIIEPGENNYSAYVPDLPGCVATGANFDEVKAAIREAIALHLDGVREDGLPIPPPTSRAVYVDVAAPGRDDPQRASGSMTEAKSRIVIDGHGIKPSTPPPVPTFGHPIRGAGEKPSTPQPKPTAKPPAGQKRD